MIPTSIHSRSRLTALALCLAGPLLWGSAAQAATGLKSCSELDLRVAAFFKVGTASLHLTDCGQADQILGDIPKQFSLDLARDFSGDDLNETARDLLISNLGLDSGDDLPEALACLASAYVDAESGDRYDVVYDPEDGLALFLNDDLLQRCENTGHGEKFFMIWFGEDPFHKRMRDRLIEQALSRDAASGLTGS